jgi:hypothetical protein
MGMGGVHFVPQLDGSIPHILWLCPFPEVIQMRLVTFENSQGDTTNSELELAAIVAQHDILEQEFDVREATIHNSSDNVATVWWQQKRTTWSNGPTDCLLRLHALHQRHYRYVPLFDYTAGKANTMTNVCRKLRHLSDTQVLAHFALLYPQIRPWKLCHLRKPVHCALISALSINASRKELQNSVPTPWKIIVRTGMNSAWPTMSIPTFRPGKIWSRCSKSLAKGIEMDACPAATSP